MIEGLKLPGLSGKVAVVTGANRGIGEAIALELARNGADIVLTARDPALLETAAGKVRELGARAATVAGDLSKPDFPASVADEALRAFGKVDILVNNAGATKRGDFLELTDADWADGFELKFFGAVRMCRTLWPELVKTKGCVINIGGAGGRTPDKPFTIGSSVNAAVMAFTKALADLGMTDGVRVNTADGWWLLRASNTQDVLVARAEAGDKAGLDRLMATINRQLEASGIEAVDAAH